MRFTKTLLTTALLGASVFSFQSTAWADTPVQQFQQGLEATTRGDYQTAFKLWLPMAEQGYAGVQFNLGVMYENGQGVKQDYFEALKWYRKAAEQGDAEAQANLGSAYTAGRGVRQDDTEAVKWVTKAAENGSARQSARPSPSGYRKRCGKSGCRSGKRVRTCEANKVKSKKVGQTV